MSYSPTNTIATVARREIHVAVRSRAIMVSVALTLVLLLGLIGVVTWLAGNEESEPDTVAVVEMSETGFANTELEAVGAADRGEAEQLVRDGDAEAALVPAEGGWELLAEGSVSPAISATVNQVVSSSALGEALGTVGVAPEEFSAAMPATTVTAIDLSDDSEMSQDQLISVTTTLVAIMVLMFTVILFAGNIGSRVTEEKSSRVIEIILAAVRPLDFLAGKIIGNAIFGLVATAIIVGVGAVALAFSGLLDGIAFDWSILPVLLIAFILGMLFFGSLYAAAGALVQRTEDLQSTQMPVMILIFAALYVPMFGFTQLNATWMEVLTWIPPMSVAVAPLQYAAGNIGVWELTGAFAILALTTMVAMWLVARIYRSAILNNGRKMSWRQALTN